MRINIPDFAMIVLVGTSGSGKSIFARRHFLPTEILSSDAMRAMVSDDENDQAATHDAFAALHYLADVRLRRRKSVVVDATNVQKEARKPLIELAHRHDCLPVALVLDVPERVCQERNRERPDRQFGPHVVINQARSLRQSLRHLRDDGFRYVHVLKPEQIENVEIVREPLWTDLRAERGPFDLIGDVHGCYEELTELLAALDYTPDAAGVYCHAEGRRAVFLGDLVDRGPHVVPVVRLVQAMMRASTGLCVPGNHDIKLARALKGNRVTVSHGLQESLDQIAVLPEAEREAFKTDYIAWADALVSHFWLDGGTLCAAHAGMKEEYIGRASGRVRDFALFGETTGETDEFGLPVRLHWAAEYRGAASVVYGHTPVPSAEWLNNTINLDTGCVFGGTLSALRYPERALVQIGAKQTYAEPVRPFLPVAPTAALADIVTELLALTERHTEARRAGVEAIAYKNSLQAEVERYERMTSEFERKSTNALEEGNQELAAQFLKERGLYTSTLTEMQAMLAGTTVAVEALKRTIRDGDNTLRAMATAVRTELPDLDAATLQGMPPQEEPKETEAECLINETMREARENQIENRELAVQAITAKNNLLAEFQHQERLSVELLRRIEAATEQGDEREIRQLVKEKREVDRTLDRIAPQLAPAEAAVEQIKANLRAEEEQLRVRTAEALAMKARMKQMEIELRIAQALDTFALLQQDMARQQELLAKRLELAAEPLSMQWQHDELLRAEDVLGKRLIETRLARNVTIPAPNAAAALEVMSRFAIEPRWLMYLPPTMSPCETAPDGEALERPAEAFAYYRAQGVSEVVCQRKHMGSRAVVVLCRDEAAARRTFGAEDGTIGQCVTRTGRRFFDNETTNRAFLTELRDALTGANFWEEFATDWVCLDGELMPWNAKAQGLLREQYAPVGAAAMRAFSQTLAAVAAAQERGIELGGLTVKLTGRYANITRYRDAYARYCWDTDGLNGIRYAPFHLMATEGKTYFDRDHDWHIATLTRLVSHSPLLMATEALRVSVDDEASCGAGAAWWQEMTDAGGEGMVVKPLSFVVRGERGLIQPAVKVRGREYLRIIYGPEYTAPENLERLRQRGLGAKRSLALREFALGVEGLERFVAKEPLRRVHECVFGVLALESEPVDPRL